MIRQQATPCHTLFSIRTNNVPRTASLSINPFCTTKAAARLSENVARLRHHTSTLVLLTWRG
jgi:hypothetical protein